MGTRISDRMMEALLFMLDNRHIMLDYLGPQFGEEVVNDAIERMYGSITGGPSTPRLIPDELDEVQKACIRTAIERNELVHIYAKCFPGLLPDVHRSLRELARLVEALGIEVSYIPAGLDDGKPLVTEEEWQRSQAAKRYNPDSTIRLRPGRRKPPPPGTSIR